MARLLAVLAAIGFVALFGGATLARADNCPPPMQAIGACEAFRTAADAPLATLAQRQASDPEVSCLEARTRTPSVLLVYEGPNVANVDAAGVRVITRFRQINDWRQLDDGTYSKMVCITKRWMQNVTSFTICGEGGHYHFNSTETAQFKHQSGPLTAADVARMWQGG